MTRDAWNLKNVSLVGHSMGCGEITRYLTRHGTARVRDIVSVTPALPFFLRTPYNPQGVPREFFGDRVAKLVPNSVLRVIRQAHP